MSLNRIDDFNIELIDEVKSYSIENGVSAVNAFKHVFLSYLIDAGETNLADCEIIEFKRTNENIKLDGYVFNEYFQSLSLLVSDYSHRVEIGKIGKVEIDKISKQALKFYKLCKGSFFSNFEESSDGYKCAEYIKQNNAHIETVHIILITNKKSITYVPDDIKLGNIKVKFDVWDIERLFLGIFSTNQADQVVIKLQQRYLTSLPLIRVQSDNPAYDCYIGSINGEILAKIYKDEGQKLIERNVRSFLQATGKINKGIRSTIGTEPHMFMAYNNGISTIAEKVEIDDALSLGNLVYINEIHGWQIVNGGQTTASIYSAMQNKLSLVNVDVQMKLTVIKEYDKINEVVSNISKYANSQNKINMSDFTANDEFHIKMERLSRNTYLPVDKGKSLDRWFYERARGQYLVELNRQDTIAKKRDFKEHNPKSRCVSKTVAAKCVMSYMGYPHEVSKGLETNFVIYTEMIKKGLISSPTEASYIDMISKVILFNECDKLISEAKFGGFKAQQNYYTIALIGKYYSDKINASAIWKNQNVDSDIVLIIKDIMYFVWNHFMNPPVIGVNIGQWCKKEECWEILKNKFENRKK